MPNNFQPKLTKIGTSLSFSTDYGFSSDINGINVNTGAGYLSSGNMIVRGTFEHIGHLFQLDGDINLIQSEKLYLNYKVQNYSDGGIYLVTGINDDTTITISGLNTAVLSFESLDSVLNGIRELSFTHEGSLYQYNINYATNFNYIETVLKSDPTFTAKFDCTSDENSLIISGRNTGSFTEAHIKDFTSYSIKYNDGWQFNNGLIITNDSIKSSSTIELDATTITLKGGDLLAGAAYVPTNNKSLATKEYVDNGGSGGGSVASSWTDGVMLKDTNILSEKNIPIGSGITIVFPTVYKVVNNMTLGNIEFVDQDEFLDITMSGNTVRVATQDKDLSFTVLSTVKIAAVITPDKIKIYSDSTYIDEIDTAETLQTVDSIQMCSSINSESFTCYATDAFTVYNYAFSQSDFDDIKILKTLVFDGLNCVDNVLFNQAYSTTELPNTVDPDNSLETDGGSIYGNGLYKPYISY